MEILIITGLSGGGKSRAASYLEDIGYYTVDNLPAEMMVKFADFCAGSSGRYDRVALVYDVRSGEPTDILIETLERLKASGVNCRMLFLEADNQTIVNRYKETRRMHPLQKKGESVEQAIRREREWMQPVRDHADFVLDTSALSIAKLRSELLDLFLEFIQDERHSIVMSSHITADLEQIADSIAYLHNGQLLFQENKDDLLQEYGVLHCGEDVLTSLPAGLVVFTRRGAYGCESLVRERRTVQELLPEAVCDAARRDDIMRFYSGRDAQ